MNGPAGIGFFQAVNLDEKTGCWNWTGHKDRCGYGVRNFQRKQRKVHRISAHLFKKFPLISEMHVLHHCDNPACFNPKHLFLGTDKDNVEDCISKGRRRAQKVIHCPKGHPYSGENLYVRPNGRRECKECGRQSALDRYYRK